MKSNTYLPYLTLEKGRIKFVNNWGSWYFDADRFEEDFVVPYNESVKDYSETYWNQVLERLRKFGKQ